MAPGPEILLPAWCVIGVGGVLVRMVPSPRDGSRRVARRLDGRPRQPTRGVRLLVPVGPGLGSGRRSGGVSPRRCAGHDKVRVGWLYVVTRNIARDMLRRRFADEQRLPTRRRTIWTVGWRCRKNWRPRGAVAVLCRFSRLPTRCGFRPMPSACGCIRRVRALPLLVQSALSIRRVRCGAGAGVRWGGMSSGPHAQA